MIPQPGNEAKILLGLLRKKKFGYAMSRRESLRQLKRQDELAKIEVIRAQFAAAGALSWTAERVESLAKKLRLPVDIVWAMGGVLDRKRRFAYRSMKKLPPAVGFLLSIFEATYVRPKSFRKVRHNERALAGNNDRDVSDGEGSSRCEGTQETRCGGQEENRDENQ